MGFLLSLKIAIKSWLTPRKKKKVSYGNYKFTLKMPTMGEQYDITEASGANQLLPEVTVVMDGLTFLESDEYLLDILERGKVVIPKFTEKSIDAERKIVANVSGLSVWAQKALPLDVYLFLVDEVEDFTKSQVRSDTREAKKNFGIWSTAQMGVVNRRSMIQSSRRNSKNMKSGLKGQIGKKEKTSP